jgi:hypothetical protein
VSIIRDTHTMERPDWLAEFAGAFDDEERRLANGLLGFSRYLLFPTPAFVRRR